MKSFFTPTYFLLVALLLGSWSSSFAQSPLPVVDWSTFLGGNDEDRGAFSITDENCNMYITGLSSSTDLPVTPDAWESGPRAHPNSGHSTFIAKLSPDGELEYLSFFGTNNSDAADHITQDEDYLYVVTKIWQSPTVPPALQSTANNLGTTATAQRILSLIKIQKSTMTPVLVTELPETAYESVAGIPRARILDILSQDGYTYMAGHRYPAGSMTWNAFFYIINPDNNSRTYVNIGPATQYSTVRRSLVAANGDLVIFGETGDPAFLTTDGTTYAGGTADYYLRRYDRNGNLLFSTLLGGSGYELTFFSTLYEDENGNIIMGGVANSDDFPYTNGSVDTNGNQDIFVAGYSGSGTQLYVNGIVSDLDYTSFVHVNLYLHPDGQQLVLYTAVGTNSDAIITADAIQPVYGGGTSDHYIAFIDPATGATNYGTFYGGSGDEKIQGNLHITSPNFAANGNSMVFAGNSTGGYPVSPATASSGGDGTFLVLNADGSLEVAATTTMGQIDDVYLMDDCIVAIGEQGGDVTFNAVQTQDFDDSGNENQAVISTIRRCDGKVAYQTFWGGTDNPAARGIGWQFRMVNYKTRGEGQINFCNNTLFVSSYADFRNQTNLFPVTEDALQPTYQIGGVDGTSLVLFAFDMDADVPWLENSITPGDQMVCTNGLAMVLDGTRVTVDPDSLPDIIRGGTIESYPEQRAIYQWQVADGPGGPWTDISGAIDEDYLPSVAGTTQYYRRIAYNPSSCECDDIISISNIAQVLAMPPLAPVANAGPPFRICVGESIQVGGSPTGTPGDEPTLTYQWEEGNNPISTASNPTVMPAATAVYTVTVTDGNGCQDLSQTTVTVFTANAGPDQQFCNGGPGVQLGTAPIAGLTGVTYSWTLNGGGDASGTLSCTTCAQPIANPPATTTYTLSVTYPSDSGNMCTLSDNVTVTVGMPPSANFAGPDTFICLTNTVLRDMATLGAAPVANFTYSWAPGAYLDATNTSQVTFDAGINLPVPNPLTYSLTAVDTLTGCVFTDQVKVYGIQADAGDDRCGPKVMGDIDDPYDGQATYTWTVIAGTGGISSDRDCTPEVTGVGQSVTGNDLNLVRATDSEIDENSTFYELLITFGDPSFQCRDTVEIIHSPCLGCIFDIETVTGNCPAFGAGDTLWLNPVTEFGAPWPTEGWTFQWSGPGQILNPAGYAAGLTDPTPGWYYLTMTSINEVTGSSCEDSGTGLVTCTDSIYINAANFAFPSYSADNEVICPGDMIMIGNPEVAGYSYSWTDSIAFTSSLAQPQVSPLSITTYYVTVTDVASITPTVPNGCFVTDSVRVQVTDVVAFAGVDRTVCDNALVTLGQPDPSGGVWQYEWSPELANYQNGTDFTSAQPQVLVAGGSITFSVTVTNPASGCSETDDITITVNNNPSILDAANQSICVGESVKIGSLGLPGVTYSWMPTTGLDNPLIAQPTANPTTTTVYTVTATFPGGCASQPTDMVTVTVNPLPTVMLTNQTICPADGVLVLDGPSGFAAYSWSPSTNMNNNTLENPTVDPAPTTATTYQLRVTDANGCNNTGTMVVTPEVQPDAGQDRILCVGETVTVGHVDNGGLGTITWTGVSGAPIGALSATNTATVLFNSAVSGVGTFTYQISINNGSGCTNTDRVTITVQGTTPPVLSPTSVCQGGCTTIGTTAQAGKIYAWFPITGLSSPGSSMTIACPTATTEYTLVVQDVATGCVTSSKVTVAVAPVAAPDAMDTDTMMCLGSELSFDGLTVAPPDMGTYGYTWSPTTGLSNPYIANPIITATMTTIYAVTVTDLVNGCADIATVTVNVIDETEDPLVITAVSENLICSDDELAVTATVVSGTANSFQWSSGGDGVIGPDDMSQMVTYMLGMQEVNNGQASLIIRAQGLCNFSTDDVTISISDPTIDGSPVGNPITCDVEQGTITVTASGGVGILEYSIDNGQTWQTSNIFTGVPPGSYLLQIRDSGLPDCIAQMEVTVPPYDCVITQPAGVTFD